MDQYQNMDLFREYSKIILESNDPVMLNSVTNIMEMYTAPNSNVKKRVISEAFGSFEHIPIRVLLQILDNWHLFYYGVKNNARMDLDLDKTVSKKEPNDIIIHFGNIDVYALMTPGNYDVFAQNISIHVAKHEIYQIILLSETQKVILLCDRDPEFIDKLIASTEKSTSYKLKIREDRNQIEIVNKIAKNYRESEVIYQDLARKLITKYPNIFNILKLIQPKITDSVNQFLELLVSKDINYDLKEILGNLGTIVIVNQNNQNNLNNCTITKSNIIASGTSNIGKNSKKSKNLLAEEWVRANPPVEKILRSEYYQKYTSEVDDCICKDQLGKILRSVYGSKNIISPKIGDERCYQYVQLSD